MLEWTLASILCVVVLLFAMPLLPGVIDSLLIEPNRNKPHIWPQPGLELYAKSRRGFFTKLYPGQVKSIEMWNGGFVNMLMSWQGRHFIGESPNNTMKRDHQEYWEVVKTPENEEDTHPLPFRWKSFGLLFSPLYAALWVWTRWVYWLTGAVWVGIPGFRSLHIYRLERYKKIMKSDGSMETVRYIDWSDHARVANFQTPVIVPRADTKNMVEVKVMLNQINQVTNPYLLFYNTDDDWMARLLGANEAATTMFSRARPHTEIIAAKDESSASEMSAFITAKVKEAVKAIGLNALETQMLDVTPTDRNTATELSRPAVAEATRQADILLAEGKAAPIRKIGEALRDFPEAMHVPGLEANVRMVEKAGDRALIFFGGDQQSGQPLQVAQIRELRELNKRLSDNDAPAT